MINEGLLLKLFDAFSIQRWTDRVRPVPLVEMDKHANKTFISYFLGKYEENKSHRSINWEFIIYSNFFELLKNIALSDIKSSVYEKIKSDKSIMTELNYWVLDQYKSLLDENLLKKFRSFLIKNIDDINYRILQAAHKLSTYREYQIIRPSNMHLEDTMRIEKELKKELSSFTDIAGFNEIYFEQDLSIVLSTIENLRNQTRWAQSVRIPATSVLGHCLFVASIALLFSIELKACPKRLYNNFFCGLFHDVPESLTRDIISPVKNATPNLPGFISKIERDKMKDDFFPYLDKSVHDEINYFTIDEFKNKVIKNNKPVKLNKTDKLEKFNEDSFNMLDGEIIKVCDHISAFIEAMQSMKYGIKSNHLNLGYDELFKIYTRKNTIVNGLDIFKIFDNLNKGRNW